MSLRHHPTSQTPERSRPRRHDGKPDQRTTTLDPRIPWTSLVVWFLASLSLGPGVTLGYGRPDRDWQPTVTSITAADGSWAEVSLAGHHGVHAVSECGPRRVWRIIEDAHALWTSLGEPGWGRFGLTVTEDRQQGLAGHPHRPTHLAAAPTALI